MGHSTDERSVRAKRHESKKKKKKDKKKRSCTTLLESDSDVESHVARKVRKQSIKLLASLGYSDEINPFGDSNLSEPFQWSKKVDEHHVTRMAQKEKKTWKKEVKRAQSERVNAIHQARKRRQEREAEKEEMDRLKSEEMRLKDAQEYTNWQEKEEEFHLKQAKVRSQLRIRANREKPVDLLAKNLLLVSAKQCGTQEKKEEEEAFFTREIDRIRVEHRRPDAIIEVLSMEELDELQQDVQTYQELEESGNQGQNAEFWTLMKILCDDRIRRLKRLSQKEGRANRGAIHDAVNETIETMLQGKNAEELQKLQGQVRETIASASNGPTGVDVDFWEEVAQQIQVYQARGRLTQLHEEMLTKLAGLMEEHERRAACAAEYKTHGVVDENGRDAGREACEMERSFTRKGLDESEEQLGASEEIVLTDAKAVPRWSEKYQPRKPRYCNRVKTGYDWNKYNQTHYDHDNPPPKVVQGYKFNLFYPDLIDKQTAPRFFLEKANSDEFCIIRFSAGPPYQDIAFKIVNREWEHSPKRGFKSVFERGILHLYFNFKRYRYRR